MSTDAKPRKVEELRVVDLRAELEKRGLDKAGIKAVLIERLKKALEDDGHNADEYEFEASLVGSAGGTPKQSRKSMERDAEEDLADHVNGDSGMKEEDEEEDQEEAQEQEEAQATKENEESAEGSEEGKSQSEAKANGTKVKEVKKDWNAGKEEAEQAEASEEEVGGDEEDTRNMEDDSINLMLEDEEKMLEDELTFNEPDRHEQEDPSQRGKERSRAKEGSPSTHAGADSTSSGKKDKDLDSESQDKKECNKPKSSGDEKGKDDKPKDDRDHKTKGSSSSSTSSSGSGRNLWVSGLASSTRAQDLKSVFSKYGKVTSAKIVTNAKTPGAKCYGFVTMMSSEDATKCISQLNHTELHGRMIQVEKAKGEPGGPSRNKASSTRKPSDSKKDSSSDKKKEGEKSDGDKKDTSSDKKEGQDEKAGKEGEKKDERRSHSRDASRSSKEHDRRVARPSRSFERRPEHRGDNYKMGHQRTGRHEVLNFKQIMEERERQRLRARERIMREEERRRREDEVRQRNIERRQREEAERLLREREKLRMERERIERQKHELLRLEREHQRMEREKLEREREELRRQQMRKDELAGKGGTVNGFLFARPGEKIIRKDELAGKGGTVNGFLFARPGEKIISNQRRYEETRRSIKRPAEDRERREFFDDRKRPAPDNRSRFESSSAPQRSRNYDRSEPARFEHNHGNHSNHGTHGSHSSGGGREDMRPPGGVGGGSRYEDRREIREREDRRPVDRSGPRDDRDHRGPMPSQASRDRPRERYSGSGLGSSGGDSWRTGGGVSDSKGNFGSSSAMIGGSLGASGLSARGGDSQGWRSSSGGDRWASSSSNLGLSVSDVLRGNLSHPPQPSMSSMSMPMMSQNDRFSMSSFRKY
ncbi:SAFB-like transcription modulator isoform X3 [Eriocheir sinensis]|uniref:SAFB-like transcription modulator isoform X3 n=1 Tax=Eriocheir sinensis TaxID=95602 RepID=UPI0021C97F0C|nr:SAFB-like transcription modulator isoform X3 [Eriocheir sinensis]